MTVTAPASAGNVTFTFADGETVPRVGDAPKIVDQDDNDATESAFLDANSPTFTTTVVTIAAYKSDNTIAGSVAWYADGNNATVTSNSHTVQGWKLTDIGDEFISASNGAYWDESGRLSGCPRFTLNGKTYSAQAITWTTSGLDIGNAPAASTELEVLAEGDTPSDSSLTFQLNDGGGWFTVVDGDVIGVDKSSDGGSDLSSMIRTDTYNCRVTLTPNTAANVTPTVRRIGVRELTREDTDGAVQFGGVTWAVDPLTLSAEISEATFSLLRDGERDYRDVGTELLSRYYPNEIELRVWIGHPDLAKQDWLLVDEFVLDDYTPREASIDLIAVSPMAHLLREVPVPDLANSKVGELNYTVATLKSAYDDLLTGQVGVQARYIGPGIENTQAVSKMIRKPRTGLDEVARLGFLAGGAIVSSQGRFKFRPFYSENVQPVAHFAFDETTVTAISPGLRRRISQYGVPYGYDERRDQGRGGYGGEYVAKVNDTILGRMGRGLLDRNEKLDDETAHWVLQSTFAGTVAERILGRFSQGELLIRFRTDIPHPHLEVGDFVTVETDDFMGRDPRAGTAIRGPVAAGGHIVRQHDWEGREFTIWVPEPLYVIPTTLDLTDDALVDNGLLAPQVTTTTLDWTVDTADGYLTVKGDANTRKLFVTVGTTSVLPSDPSTGTWDYSSTSRVLTTATTGVSLGETAVVKARAWNNAWGGTFGDVERTTFTPRSEQLNISHDLLLPFPSTAAFTTAPGYLTTSTGTGDSSQRLFHYPLGGVLPLGALMTDFTSQLYRETTSCVAQARLKYGTAAAPSTGFGFKITDSLLESTGIGWTEPTTTTSRSVVATNNYWIEVTLKNTTGGDQAGVSTTKLGYNAPHFDAST